MNKDYKMMKRIILFISVLFLTLGFQPALAEAPEVQQTEVVSATLTKQQIKKLQKYSPFSVLGDSYSTFEGFTEPRDNRQWYPLHKDANDVREVNETWWQRFAHDTGCVLERNNSFSGSTVCYTGYGKEYVKPSSFVTRCENLGNPKAIFILGATNDCWAESPLGEYKYKEWTEEDLKSFRPAMAKMLYQIRKTYPKVKIVFILNDDLSGNINTSVEVICKHYKVPLFKLQHIQKQGGHPSVVGMRMIEMQLIDYLTK